MRRALTICLVLAGLGPVSVAQTSYAPPPPGTLLSWRYQFDGDGYTRLSEIVATGEDFVIYDPDISYTKGASSKYVVEYSGIHAQSCNEPLLDESDRQALKSMWPLVNGASATVKSGAMDTHYAVTGIESVELIAPTTGSTTAARVRGRFGEAGMEVLVSQQYGIPVELSWSAGGNGRVLEIVEPQGSAPDLEQLGNLGRCASLLR